MKKGSLIKVVKNDMSLVIKKPGPKDYLFFNQVGIILKKSDYNCRIFFWYDILVPAGVYSAREDAIELINESK